jgi:predicted amidohydrolase
MARVTRNTVSILDSLGNCALTYAKVHTCDFSDEKYLTPGDDFYVTSLNTDKGEMNLPAPRLPRASGFLGIRPHCE